MNSSQSNDYANSMFRFERFNDTWLTACSNYIKFLFGDSVQGKRVIDYAFGRGNWSLAFIAAGAKEVIAIDASIDNVTRFKEYCKNNAINNIKIIHGNILHDDLQLNCDIFWLYGILQHIEELDLFLSKVKKWMKTNDSFIYIYYYNKNSLRELIVESCRKLHRYSSETEFIEDNYLFLRLAKNRASDDLVAPYIGWKTSKELSNDLKRNGLYILREDIDFMEFSKGIVNKEFYPHQFMCSQNKEQGTEVKEKEIEFKTELDILISILTDILTIFKDSEERKKISIGLFNTHFNNLRDASDIRETLKEVFLYLMRLLIQAKAFKKPEISDITEAYYQMLLESMTGNLKAGPAVKSDKNLFTEYMTTDTIRL